MNLVLRSALPVGQSTTPKSYPQEPLFSSPFLHNLTGLPALLLSQWPNPYYGYSNSHAHRPHHRLQ
jgi:hypothetical protein